MSTASAAGPTASLLDAPAAPAALTPGLLERCTFPAPGTAVDLAVSGGPDSSALLVLAVAAGLSVTAHHVDHGLRPDGDREAAAVVALATSWGAAAVTHRVEVGDGPDLEARLRSARLGVLPPGALMGHTADDLAETVLMRIMRGTGPSGLAAMDPATHPLLRVRRAETVELCRRLGIDALVDPTNADPRFTRNRVRAEVLPLMSDVAGRDVVPLLCRLSELVARTTSGAGPAASVDPGDVRALRELGGPDAREVLRGWWREVTGQLPPGAAAIERMLDVVQGRARACDVAAGWRLVRSKGRLRLVRGAGPDPADRTERAGR